MAATYVLSVELVRVGLVAQRTRAFQTSLDVPRGFLVGVSGKQWEFTIYVFNAGFTDLPWCWRSV